MAGAEKEEEGIAVLVGRVVEDARSLVGAEVNLYKAKATERIVAYRAAVAFFVVAGVLALAALIAMLVGIIMTVATLVGPGLATAIVTGVTLVIAAILGLLGKAKLSPPKISEPAS